MRTIAQIIAANRAIGHHWFDADTMEHWGTEVYDYTADGGDDVTVFLVSDENSEYSSAGRRYRPCLSMPEGTVKNLMRIYTGPAFMHDGMLLVDSAAMLLRQGVDYRDVRARLAETI